VRAIASRFAPDLIYAHGSVLNGEVGRRLQSVVNAPLVCHDHDYGEIRACNELRSRRRHLTRVCEAAAATIVVSSAMEADLRAVVPGARIAVVPNGADPDPEPPRRSNEPTVLCVSGFYPRKQIPFLIDVFAVVAARNHDARLRIIGDGPEHRDVEAAIAGHHLEDRVTLVGRQRHESVLAEMRNAAVFALLSREEPFGVVYLEALAAGVPVVCSDDAGVTDVIEDDVHGRIVACGQLDQAATAVIELLANPAARARMGDAGRALIERRLSWDTNARALVELFASTVGPRTPPLGEATGGHLRAQTR
jgi:glycosyltransferase involved in cell wall biosynthesis